MKSILRKPYFYFWVTAGFILIPELILSIKIGGSELDINVHDTYFIIDSLVLAFILFAFYLSLGVFYYVFKHLKIELKSILTFIHTIITVGAIFVYKILNLYFSKSLKNISSFEYDMNQSSIILIWSLIVLAAQILFIFNLIISSIIGFKKRHKN